MALPSPLLDRLKLAMGGGAAAPTALHHLYPQMAAQQGNPAVAIADFIAKYAHGAGGGRSYGEPNPMLHGHIVPPGHGDHLDAPPGYAESTHDVALWEARHPGALRTGHGIPGWVEEALAGKINPPQHGMPAPAAPPPFQPLPVPGPAAAGIAGSGLGGQNLGTHPAAVPARGTLPGPVPIGSRGGAYQPPIRRPISIAHAAGV